jgi:trimethylamine--corrinoid protein Co-methyltransferase
LKVFDFGKAVEDDEIALMLKQIKRGFEFGEEEIGLNIIAQVGPGGSFMVQPHTIKRMKTTGLLPKLADRNPRENWEGKGSLDTQGRALQRVREILARPSLAVFPAEVDDRLRAAFPGLVAGKLEPPTGWN